MKLKASCEKADGTGDYHRWLKKFTVRRKRKQLKELMTVGQYEDVTPKLYKRHRGWET